MNAIDKDLRICLIACALTAASLAWGHESGPEYIESFDTTIEIHDGGGLHVRHVIDVHPHGDEIKRGLFFDLPDQIGPLESFSATLNDTPIGPEFDNGAIVIAAEQPLEQHQRHRFMLQYRAPSPWWWESQESARLRWAPLIEQFEMPWKSASVRIEWPADFKPELPAFGSTDGNRWHVEMRGPANDAGAREAVEILELRADPGALASRSVRRHGTKWGWRTGLVCAIFVLLGFLHSAWRAVGRDPDLGSVPTRSSAPDGISPAAARFVDRMGYDETAFVTALVSLRVRGAIELSVAEDGESMSLIRSRESNVKLSPGEQAILAELFQQGDSIVLEPGDTRGQKASEALKNKLGTEHRGRHFVTNSRQRALGFVVGSVVSVAGLVSLILQGRDDLTPDPWVIALGFAALLIGVIAPAIYFELFKAPTRAGVTVKRQIAGLKRYLESGPPIRDARHFISLLPYAVALDAEEAWRDRFESGNESEAQQDVIEVLEWYREIQQSHDSIAAMVPIMAAAAGASVTTSVGASGGASAGGV